MLVRHPEPGPPISIHGLIENRIVASSSISEWAGFSFFFCSSSPKQPTAPSTSFRAATAAMMATTRNCRVLDSVRGIPQFALYSDIFVAMLVLCVVIRLPWRWARCSSRSRGGGLLVEVGHADAAHSSSQQQLQSIVAGSPHLEQRFLHDFRAIASVL